MPPRYSPSKPAVRRLRGYAFDPSLSLRMDTALMNEVVFRVPWEDGLKPGPVGEYLEVVDVDPASGCAYVPVDLDAPELLAEDGLAPAESSPQFHQQMVYAVAMTTIRNFERALGRPVLWADGPGNLGYPFVPRLRVYPHAFRGANAYFSPEKQALLFGYFPATEESRADHFPGGMVFTCLSHDIIAHETAHAILHGEHRRWSEPSNPDMLAFHEAFADIVALFQHFSFPEVLVAEVGRVRGDIGSATFLTQLAVEFGRATGQHGALREYLEKEADPTLLGRTTEPHARGAILVAAVFDAFRAVYRARVRDLVRIATGGTGVLEQGELHPALARQLSVEAAKSARHVLRMCIRALDYTPPVDMEFGEYLRAIITADLDHVPLDDLGYRVAFVEAFRRHGIYPRGVRTMSVDGLRWRQVRGALSPAEQRRLDDDVEVLARHLHDAVSAAERELPNPLEQGVRERFHRLMHTVAGHMKRLLEGEDAALFARITGDALVLPGAPPGHNVRTDENGQPVFAVELVRFARRAGPDGDRVNHAIVVVTQKHNSARTPPIRGGCTLIFDLDTLTLRYAITKPIVEARVPSILDRRATAVQALRTNPYGSPDRREPFALLHRSHRGEP